MKSAIRIQSCLETIYGDERIKKLNSPSLSRRQLRVGLITFAIFVEDVYSSRSQCGTEGHNFHIS